MSENTNVAIDPNQEQTLFEFCANLSLSDRRVELISAFNHVEKAAGRIKDTFSNYRTRYTAFISQPA